MGAQTFNRYNLFYRLERNLLLHERGAGTKKEDYSTEYELVKQFDGLELPPLPTQYRHLDLPKLWFISSTGSNKKRSHRKR